MLFLKYTENECSEKYFYVNENTQTLNSSEKMYTTSLVSTITKKVLMLIRVKMRSHQAEREADTYSLHFYCLTGTLILNIQKADLKDVLILKKCVNFIYSYKQSDRNMCKLDILLPSFCYFLKYDFYIHFIYFLQHMCNKNL